ncbi:MAG: hypothetical protein ACRC8U_06490 [Brooklawnia sp.]
MTDLDLDMDSQDALAAEDAAAHDQALDMAGDGDVTFGPGGGPATLTSDPYDVLSRDDAGPALLPYEGDWPDGLDPAPAGFDQMDPFDRIDWLTDHGWPSDCITADGYPTGDPSLTYEPAMPGPPEPAAPTVKTGDQTGTEKEWYERQVQQHGLTRTPPGGKGSVDKKKILGMGPRGTGIGGSGITINLFNLAGWFSGAFSPRAEVGSGNTGSLLAASAHRKTGRKR